LAIPAAQLPATQPVPAIALAIPQCQHALIRRARDEPAPLRAEADLRKPGRSGSLDVLTVDEPAALGTAMHGAALRVRQFSAGGLPCRRLQLDDFSRRSDRCARQF